MKNKAFVPVYPAVLHGRKVVLRESTWKSRAVKEATVLQEVLLIIINTLLSVFPPANDSDVLGSIERKVRQV